MNKFTKTTMPDAGRAFEVIWHNADGSEVIYPGIHDDWIKYMALYPDPPIAPFWRYIP